MAMESKYDIYCMIPKKYIPITIKADNLESLTQIHQKMVIYGLRFPIIIKPDIGMKGFGVEKIYNLKELLAHTLKLYGNYLLQEWIDYENEIGIFYVRLPNENRGKITGMVLKKYLSVIGDGKSTIRQLIKNNYRSARQLSQLEHKLGTKINCILDEEEMFTLLPIGSHTRGALFIDISDKKTKNLERFIDAICRQLPDFYFGRLDIKFKSLKSLAEGKDFKIIEINGAGSEPTHIYDPKNSIFIAWKEIIRHWNYLCRISIQNHKNGVKHISLLDALLMVKQNRRLLKRLSTI